MGDSSADFKLVHDSTEVTVQSGNELPGGVWVLQSVVVPKHAVLVFDKPTRLYLIGKTGIWSLRTGEGANIKARKAGSPEVNPESLQIIVPCLERQGGVTAESDPNEFFCDTLDQSGVCQDTVGNPDENKCTDPNNGSVTFGKGSVVKGSIHAPTRNLWAGEGVTVDGEYVVADEVFVGKGTKFKIPIELGVPDPNNPSAPAQDVRVRMWRHQQPSD